LIRYRLFALLLLLGALLLTWACGKKAPPFLPQKPFLTKVIDLHGKWVQGEILLTGHLLQPDGEKGGSPQISGCKVYYATFSTDNPPCEGCPIKFTRYYEFGAEVITSKGFHCIIPGADKVRIYHIKVHLTGPDNTVGPASDIIRIEGE
jgi:hypothetical protein